MTFSPGMMQTATNEARAMEERAKGIGGLCVSACVCVCECVCVCAGFATEAFEISGQDI